VYLEVLGHEKIALELNLAEAQNRVEARRAELVEAQRNRKAMTNLRDHQASLHAKEMAKLEQKELDALGTDRAARGLIGL
jgi:flagellar export protein FliJ